MTWHRFPNGVITEPWCAPTRATLMTGRWPHNHGIVTNNAASTSLNGGLKAHDFLPAAMKRVGYRTWWVGKFQNGYPWQSKSGGSYTYVPPGLDVCSLKSDDRSPAEGFDSYTSYTLVEKMTPGATPAEVGYQGNDTANYATDVITAKAVDCIAWADTTGAPWFGVLAYTAPHPDAVPAARHAASLPAFSFPHSTNHNEADISDKPTWMQSFGQFTPQDIADMDAEMQDIARTCLAVDEGIMDVLAEVDLAETIVTFLPDNGNLYGPHRWRGKTVLFEEAITGDIVVNWPTAPTGRPNVLLIILDDTPAQVMQYLPDFDALAAGANNAAVIADVDIAPTIAGVAGAHLPVAPDGASLAPLLDGDVAAADFREAALIELPSDFWQSGLRHSYGLRSPTWKYIEYLNGDAERYEGADLAHGQEMMSLGYSASLHDKLRRVYWPT